MSDLGITIKDSISKAINFLYQNQLSHGEFKTLVSWNPWLLGSYYDSSPFITSLILYSINDLEDEKIERIKKRAIDFLLAEEEKGGIWRFWTKRNKKKLPPDLDDISNISFILKINGISFENNLQLILNNKNKENLFLTWLIDEKNKNEISWWVRPWIDKEDVDWVVNANVLLYLGKDDPNVCSFINQTLKFKKPPPTYSLNKSVSIYPNQLAFFYMVSRAFKNGIGAFKESKELIIKSTLNYQKKNGSFGNDLKTALALNTLFNFDYSGKEIDLGINYFLKNQRSNGSWKRSFLFLGPFPYLFYGSEELTTALAIEAMENYFQVLEAGN